MRTTDRLYTLSEFATLPTGGEARYELIQGALITMSPSGTRHGQIAATLIILLGGFIRANALGALISSETGFILERNPDTVRAPDVAFIPAERIPAEGLPSGFSDIVPALVVEVISPSETASMVQAKTQAWLAFGVSQVWNVYPDTASVYIFTPDDNGGKYQVYSGDDVLSGGNVLTDFRVKTSEIFAG